MNEISQLISSTIYRFYLEKVLLDQIGITTPVIS